MVRVSTVPGVWEWMVECPACDGAGVTDVEVAVPDPIRGGYLSEELGEAGLELLEDSDHADEVAPQLLVGRRLGLHALLRADHVVELGEPQEEHERLLE